MAGRCVQFLVEKIQAGSDDSAMIGLCNGRLTLHDLQEFPRMVESGARRPREQHWMASRPIARVLAQLHPPAS
jgi:6-phosphofructokinase 1